MNREWKKKKCKADLIAFLDDDDAMNVSIQTPNGTETNRHYVQFVKVKGETSFSRQPVVCVYGGEFSDAYPRIKQLDLLGVCHNQHIYTRDFCLVHGITYGFEAFEDVFELIDIESQVSDALDSICKDAKVQFPEASTVTENDADLNDSSFRKKIAGFIIQQKEDGAKFDASLREAFKEYLDDHLENITLGDMLFDLIHFLECKKHEFMKERADTVQFLLHKKAVCLKGIAAMHCNLPQTIAMARDIYAAAAKAGTTTTVHLLIGMKQFVVKMRTQSLMYGDTTYPTWDITPKQTRDEVEAALREQGMNTLTPESVTKICYGRKVLYEKSKVN